MNNIFEFRIPVGKQFKTKEQLEIAELVRKIQPKPSIFIAYCPYCGKKLVKHNRDRYESLSEHVSDPNGIPTMKQSYTCPDEGCQGNKTCCVLKSGGEVYCRHDREWVSSPLSPIPSFCASQDYQDYCNGLPRHSRGLKLWKGYELFFEYDYIVDNFGVMLKRYATLTLTKNNCYKSWWIDTWVYLWKRYKRKRDKTVYTRSWNRDFPYRAFEWFLGHIVNPKIKFIERK